MRNWGKTVLAGTALLLTGLFVAEIHNPQIIGDIGVIVVLAGVWWIIRGVIDWRRTRRGSAPTLPHP